MKIIYLLFILTLVISCTKQNIDSQKNNNEIVVPEFQMILDSAELVGGILIYDLKNDRYYSNDFKWAKQGKLPASTFKIANSIIALEAGVIENESTIFEWKGERRSYSVWEQDLTFKNAFHFSCVPCYQEVARNIGPKKMTAYLDKLDYGNIAVDSSNIDMFWLEGNSKINQMQQINFLKRFYQSKLPISDRTELMMKKMMIVDENDAYSLSGKTGWSISNDNNNGWFVGYVEAQNNTYFFATNIEPGEQFDMSLFPIMRKKLTYQALEKMNIIN